MTTLTRLSMTGEERRLFEHSHHHQRRLLLGGEQFLQLALGGGELFAGLGAGLAEGGEFGLDLVGAGVVFDGLLEVAGLLCDGRIVLRAAGTPEPAAATAGRCTAAASTRATATAAARPAAA